MLFADRIDVFFFGVCVSVCVFASLNVFPLEFWGVLHKASAFDANFFFAHERTTPERGAGQHSAAFVHQIYINGA